MNKPCYDCYDKKFELTSKGEAVDCPTCQSQEVVDRYKAELTKANAEYNKLAAFKVEEVEKLLERVVSLAERNASLNKQLEQQTAQMNKLRAERDEAREVVQDAYLHNGNSNLSREILNIALTRWSKP